MSESSLESLLYASGIAGVAGRNSADRNDLWTLERLDVGRLDGDGQRIQTQRPSGVRTPAQLSRTCW